MHQLTDRVMKEFTVKKIEVSSTFLVKYKCTELHLCFYYCVMVKIEQCTTPGNKYVVLKSNSSVFISKSSKGSKI